MLGPGKIQTVYTTSKKGKRERLGQWFLRSAHRSLSKRGNATQGATSDITASADACVTPSPLRQVAFDSSAGVGIDEANEGPPINNQDNDAVAREQRSSPANPSKPEDETDSLLDSDSNGGSPSGAQSRVSSRLVVADDVAQLNEIEETKYWGPTRSIEEEKLLQLVERVVKKPDGAANVSYTLINKCCGSYNCAYVLESSYKERLCIRVPACGFPDRWNDFDGKLLRETALGMGYIRNKTDLPVPRLLSYDTSMNNEIETPFIMMSFLSGKSVEEVWPQRDGEDFAITDARRHQILRNIAKTMRLLEPTVFSRYGALLFETDDAVPNVGDSSRLTTDDIFILQRKFKAIPSRSSLGDYVHAAKRKRFEEFRYPHDTDDYFIKGLFAFWELCCDRFLDVVKVEASEPDFVLMQSDFSPQNILVDDENNITGLIDWDCLETVPRQIGWCSQPHWTQKDWSPEYVWPTPEGAKQILQPHEFDKYRKAYTRYIREACPGQNDSRFTAKSHIYSALLRSGEHIDNVKCFVANVLGDVLPRLGSVQDVWISHVGEHGYKKDQKEWLDERLREYFAPDA